MLNQYIRERSFLASLSNTSTFSLIFRSVISWNIENGLLGLFMTNLYRSVKACVCVWLAASGTSQELRRCPLYIVRNATRTFHTGKSAEWTINKWRFAAHHVYPDLGVTQLVPKLPRNAIGSSTFRRCTIRNFNRKVGSSLLITKVKIVWSKLQVEKVLPFPPPSHSPRSTTSSWFCPNLLPIVFSLQ